MSFQVPERDPCPFCDNIAHRRTVSSRDGSVVPCAVVEEVEASFAFIIPRQIAPPHVLVIPKRHAPTVLDLTADEAAAVARHAHRLAAAIMKAFDPAGLNIYQNNGIRAGQSVGHYHVHLVPRYGDGGDVRVVSTSELPRTPFDELERLAAVLRSAFA